MWLERGLNCCAQSVVISGLKSRWRPVTTGMFQRLIPGPIEFNTFINGLDDGTACTLSKFAEELVDTPDGCAAIQKKVDGLEKWAKKNLMKYEKGICQVLHLGTNNLMHWYTLQADKLERSFAEKEL